MRILFVFIASIVIGTISNLDDTMFLANCLISAVIMIGMSIGDPGFDSLSKRTIVPLVLYECLFFFLYFFVAIIYAKIAFFTASVGFILLLIVRLFQIEKS